MTVATEYERYMLELINADRLAEGLNALTLELNLNLAADLHSTWMTEADTFSHTGLDGSSPTIRIREAGMDLSGSWGTAENIGAVSVQGSDSYYDEIDRLHAGLMNSPGHRANLLDADLTHIGLGLGFGPLTYSSGVSLPSVLITQNFSYTGGISDHDLLGDAGGNTLRGAEGDDHMDGAGGRDLLDGSAGDDTLIGGGGFDTLRGGTGDDSIDGGTHNDRIFAGDGNDVVMGGLGRDSIWLGNGDDRFIDVGQAGRLGADRVIAGAGNDTLEGGGGNDTLNGGNGDDVVSGGAGADLIFAGNGADRVDGGNGRDRAFLGAGDDQYTDTGQTGNFGADRVIGGAGNDTIEAGGGNDTLTGGTEADTFIFIGATIEADVITDYTVGEDALQIDTALFGGGLTTAEVLAQYADASSGTVVFDFGSGNTITLTGVSTLAGLESDITLL